MNAVTPAALGPSRPLTLAFIAHCAASLIHFVHNAVYLDDYPNLPAWLTATVVYASWCALTAIGLTGMLLHRYGCRRPGLCTLVLYALLGFAGLDHYTAAAIRAHTLAMNLAIWLETLTASLLLFVVLRELAKGVRRS